uniref:Uncharacterized protein n=1 Tax=Arundo donax TaxID=35708 RepID=A0A0A8ZFX8_ARUDO
MFDEKCKLSRPTKTYIQILIPNQQRMKHLWKGIICANAFST